MAERVRRILAVATVAMLAVLLLVSPAYGQDQQGEQGQQVQQATTGQDNWQTLTGGQSVWYTFQYGGDDDEAQIRLAGDPSDAVGFTVWTENEWLNRGGDEDVVGPIGRGTPNEFEAGDLFWQGSSNDAGTYYVLVEPDGTSDVRFWIELTGPGAASGLRSQTQAQSEEQVVTEQAQPEAAAPTPAPVESAAQPPAPEAEAMPEAEATPEAADGFRTLATGGHWYRFPYSGEDDEVTIRMDADPNNAAGFTVWTEDQRANIADEDQDPLGRGTPNEFEQGDLFWLGSSPAADTYYILVEPVGLQEGVRYRLTIEGPGVAGLLQPEFEEQMAEQAQ